MYSIHATIGTNSFENFHHIQKLSLLNDKFLYVEVMIKLIMTTLRTTLRILDVNLPVGPHKLNWYYKLINQKKVFSLITSF